MAFARYVEETRLPHHRMESSTRRRYTYSLRKHVLPEFGPVRTVASCPNTYAPGARLRDEGVSVGTINANKAILGAVFTTALNDQVTFVHPCKAPLSIRGRLLATVCFGCAAIGSATLGRLADRYSDLSLMTVVFLLVTGAMVLAGVPGGHVLLGRARRAEQN